MKIFGRAFLFFILLFSFQTAFAEVATDGVLNQVGERFLTESEKWGKIITGHASWLFWTLVIISMVWTFGLMALRKADIQEFFAEFIKFIIFVGFFWWLLLNGPEYAMSIINSLRKIGAEASGLTKLNPSTPISIAFDILIKAGKSYSVTSPIDNLSIFLISLAILACMAIVAANILLALITAYVLAYAGIFVLGFGGSKWTSDIAINYFRNVLGIALKIMTMTLLVGIAVSIMDGYHASLAAKASMDELMIIFTVALVLVILINTIPNIVAGLVPGGGGAASTGSSFGAGAIIGAGAAAVGMATGGAAMAGKAIMGATTGAAGIGSAISAAMQAAQGGGSDAGLGSIAGSAGPSEAGTAGSTPFAQAAGLDSAGSSGSDGVSTDTGGGAGSDGGTDTSSGADGGTDTSSGADGSGSDGSSGSGGGGSDGGGSDGGGSGGSGSDSPKSKLALAAATAGKLGQGIKSMAVESAKAKISNTAGGRLAEAIKASSGQTPAVNAGGTKTSSTGTAAGGWAGQSGGFDSLSSSDKNKATQAHALWQESNPERNTFDLNSYVSYVQEHKKNEG